MIYEAEIYYSRTIQDRELDYREPAYAHGIYSAGTPVIIPTAFSGTEYGGLGAAVFETIYLTEESYDLGFIVSDITKNITLWNAYTKTSKTLQSIYLHGNDNFTLDFYNTPLIFLPGATLTKQFTVTREGMLPQYTIIQYSFTFETLQSIIIGVRAESMYFHCNTKNIDFELKFKTAEFKNERSISRRRSLLDYPEYVLTITYIESKENLSELYYKLQAAKARPILVPLYFAAETVKTDPAGGNTLELTENVEINFFMLNNSFVTIPGEAVTKQIVSVSGNTITCNSLFSNIAIGTKVFPAFLGIIDKFSLIAQTNQTSIFSITYKTIAIDEKITYTLLDDFNFELINYKTLKTEFNLNKLNLKHGVSAYEIFEYTNKVQRIYSGNALLNSKQESYNFLSYLYAAKGKLNSFYCRNPIDAFTLKFDAVITNDYFVIHKIDETSIATDTKIIITAANIQETYTITSITQFIDFTRLYVTPNLTRNIKIEEVEIFTTLDNVIFDQDSFKLKFLAKDITSCDLKFRTL